jgi:hypothetical protein
VQFSDICRIFGAKTSDIFSLNKSLIIGTRVPIIGWNLESISIYFIGFLYIYLKKG